jgi:hypothetical protein
MAQIESSMNMGFDGYHAVDDGTAESVQTQKFIKIITTFASRVDLSVSKAQLTIDILLNQYNLPLTPKEVVEDNSSKIQSVMSVIRRAAALQRDVDRLGQVLVNRPNIVTGPPQPYQSPHQQRKEEANSVQRDEAFVRY